MDRFNIKKFYNWPFSTQLLIYSLLFVILLYMGYQWSFAPLTLELDNAKGQENYLKSEMKGIIRREFILNNYLAQLPEFQQQFAQLKKTMIDRSGSPELLKEILTKGNINHLRFSLFDPSEEKTEQGYYKIKIKIIAIGDYHQLATFMSEVANMPSIVVIDNFIISSENKKDPSLEKKSEAPVQAGNSLTAELMLEVYQLPETNP